MYEIYCLGACFGHLCFQIGFGSQIINEICCLGACFRGNRYLGIKKSGVDTGFGSGGLRQVFREFLSLDCGVLAGCLGYGGKFIIGGCEYESWSWC